MYDNSRSAVRPRAEGVERSLRGYRPLRRFVFELGQRGDAFAAPTQEQRSIGPAIHELVGGAAQFREFSAFSVSERTFGIRRQQLIVARDLGRGQFFAQLLPQSFGAQ